MQRNGVDISGITVSKTAATSFSDVMSVESTGERTFFHHNCGVSERAIIHCPEAGFALNKNGDFTVVPSLKLPRGYIKGSVGAGDESALDMYTRVDEAEVYLKAIGVDVLAVSIGTAHGAYKSKPKLDFNRLSEIHNAIPVPLVLHGRSGLSDDDFKNAIANGISKVNIFTGLCAAGILACKESVEKTPLPLDMNTYLEMRNLKVEKMKDAVKEKIMLFGYNGRA